MGEIKTGQVTKKSRLSRTTALIIIVFIVIISGLVIFVFMSKHKTTVSVVTNICAEKKNLYLTSQAIRAIEQNNLTSIVSSTKKISLLSGSGNDPNCVYLMFKAAQLTGNFSQANKYLSYLANHYPKNGFMPMIGIQSIAQLKSSLETTIQAERQAANNSLVIRRPK